MWSLLAKAKAKKKKTPTHYVQHAQQFLRNDIWKFHKSKLLLNVSNLTKGAPSRLCRMTPGCTELFTALNLITECITAKIIDTDDALT